MIGLICNKSWKNYIKFVRKFKTKFSKIQENFNKIWNLLVNFKKVQENLRYFLKIKKLWKFKKLFSKFEKILLILHEKSKAVMINKKCFCIFR